MNGDQKTKANPSGQAQVVYLPYPKAIQRLKELHEATPEELAAWVWLGPLEGGVTAYLHAKELDPPPRFYFDSEGGYDFDYLFPLMACWFREDEIAGFAPAERFITGHSLVERWIKRPDIEPEAFIRAKIAESRLADAHPIAGGTRGTFPRDKDYPPLTSGLFALSQVEKVEAEDFPDVDELDGLSPSPCQPVTASQMEAEDIDAEDLLDGDELKRGSPGSCQVVSASQIMLHFRVIKDPVANIKWWKNLMQDASRNGLSRIRVGAGRRGPGGSLWRPDLIAAWLVDRESNGRGEGMDVECARTALKKFPGYLESAHFISC